MIVCNERGRETPFRFIDYPLTTENKLHSICWDHDAALIDDVAEIILFFYVVFAINILSANSRCC